MRTSIISCVASFLVPITELDTISSLLYFHDICNLRFCPFLVCYSRFEGDEVGMPKHGIDGECKDIKCFFKECSASSKFQKEGINEENTSLHTIHIGFIVG